LNPKIRSILCNLDNIFKLYYNVIGILKIKEETMGNELLFTIPNHWEWWITLGIGLFIFVVGWICLLMMGEQVPGNPDKKITVGPRQKIFCISVISIGLITCFSTIAVNYLCIKPADRTSREEALSQAKIIQEVYQGNFYLKELSRGDGTWGEASGEISGGFLFIHGSMYGSVQSGKIISVIYEDNDAIIDPLTNVSRGICLNLEEIIIETIPAGEKPYISFTEANVYFVQKYDPPYGYNQVKLVPGRVWLYLPEGWELLR
jgi:hypothetical protein